MTPRSYTSPAAFKTAVEHRLRAQAQAEAIDMGRLRQLMIFDRFLARVFRVFQDAVVLKGGLALELRLHRARTTKDVDLRVVGNPDETLEKLRDAGELALGDHLRFQVAPDPRNPKIEADGLLYEGLRYRVEAQLAGKIYGQSFGVDVAFAEPLDAEPEQALGDDFLGFAGIEPTPLLIYPLRTHIAEKLHAYTLPRPTPNSRVKDLPDIALLATTQPIAARELHRAIEQTFGHRNTHAVPTRLPEPPAQWGPPYAQMAKADALPWPDLARVFLAASEVIDPVLAGGLGRFDPARWGWF